MPGPQAGRRERAARKPVVTNGNGNDLGRCGLCLRQNPLGVIGPADLPAPTGPRATAFPHEHGTSRARSSLPRPPHSPYQRTN